MEKKYRKNVAIVVFNKDKKLLLCERIGKGSSWQFPQGGIDNNENIEEAAFRELYEETSIKSVNLVELTKNPIKYDFPEDIRKKLWKSSNKDYDKFYGQEQYWALFYFHGKDDEINMNTPNPEFKSFSWQSSSFAINNIIDFKKESYKKALTLLEPIVNGYDVK